MLLITAIHMRFCKRRHRSSRFIESRPGHPLSDGPCWLACLECWRSLAVVGRLAGMRAEQGCDLGLDRLRQQRSRGVAVCGSGKVPGCESWKSLVSVTAYHSFGGEVGLEHPDTPPYPPTPSPTGIAARECLPRRTATISARIEIAISSGVIAPRSSPAGALSLARRSAETPCSPSFSFSASAFLWLPTNARYLASTANAASNAASSPRPCVETTTYRSPASSTGNA